MARCGIHDAAGRTRCRPGRARRAAAAGLLLLFAGACAAEIPGATWRYYRPGNTGIQGDYNDAIFIGADGDPWIGGYDPGFEEGGVAKLVQAENRWINVSNIDHPVIGHPNLTGTTRVSDIAADAAGQLWMVTWRGLLRMDPAIGGPSVVNLAAASPPLANGGRDLDIAPDGSVWIALRGFGNAQGGVIRHRPATSEWRYWTGGATPQGGNGWPQPVWNVAHVAIQPKPGGGYRVWADADNGAATVVFDSDTQLWTHQPYDFTPGAVLDLPGKDAVDEAGNLWAIRFSHVVGSQPVHSLDYRTPGGTWVVPPQLSLPAVTPTVWAFKALATAAPCSPTGPAASGASTARSGTTSASGARAPSPAASRSTPRAMSGPAAPAVRRSAMRPPASGSATASPTPVNTTTSTATSRSTRRADGFMPARTRAPASAA